ncbi:MAG: BrnT family toxin [Candidatus Brocadia sp.]|jgi:Uncharacterized protein conserved in bacteria|uniref:BrnT family toxin n=1 Tax=Candidatus Brocadia fulgida TaxID=380242 RepID=A0A0M2UWV7_9BACT|nr:MAG: hypothetical protein BROFUL_01231 [Candidatus Brocadia fulgida]MBV6467846.1 hypothetical protein [Anaerolineales bacterium]UJS22159.1 MAG: BrnT family toxin [Candidatus Brocadia sp.]
MELNFEWDEEKAKAKFRKHKVSFGEATTVFIDPLSITICDPNHSIDEQRYIDIGSSENGRVLVVVYTERGFNIRIISCRKATASERKLYRNGNFMKKGNDKIVPAEGNNMRTEYDFTGGVRGKHYKTMQNGYTVSIHKADGTTVVKEVMPKKGAVIIEPDIRAYFPDSESVNRALRCLIPLLSKKRKAKTKKA